MTRFNLLIFQVTFLLLLIFGAREPSFALDMTSSKSLNPSPLNPSQAQLRLTHFIFTQVIESYLEDGDRFIIEDIRGSGDRLYQYLLEKKFFVAFLKAWQSQLDRKDLSYSSSLEIFRQIFKESVFLKTNSSYLTKTVGLPPLLDGSDLDVVAHQRWSTKDSPLLPKSFSTSQIPIINENGLKPLHTYPVQLGFDRQGFLIQALQSEREPNETNRLLHLLDGYARSMAHQPDDRRTVIWLISFFLNNPSPVVSNKAQSILNHIHLNELADHVSDVRWLILGGRYLWSQREAAVKGLHLLGQSQRALRLKNWIQLLGQKTKKTFEILKNLKNSNLSAYHQRLSALSFYRYLRAMHPKYWAAGAISVGGHIALYNHFANQVSSNSNFEKDFREITQAMGFSDEMVKTLISDSKVDESEDDLTRLAKHSPYAELKKFNITPLELLDRVQPVPLNTPEELKNRAKAWLNENTHKDRISFNYGSYFLQDEFFNRISNTLSKDLRLLSIAESVKNEDLKDLSALLRSQNVETFNQLTQYEKFRETLVQAIDLLKKKHTFYYSVEARSLIREMLGEGGNCVGISYLQLSLLQPLWGEGDWKLGVVFKPKHVLLAAYSVKTGWVMELDSLSEGDLASYPNAIYHPDLLVAASLGITKSNDYLVFQNKLSATELAHDVLSHFGIHHRAPDEASSFWGKIQKTTDEAKSLVRDIVRNLGERINNIYDPYINNNESGEETKSPLFALDQGSAQASFTDWSQRVARDLKEFFKEENEKINNKNPDDLSQLYSQISQIGAWNKWVDEYYEVAYYTTSPFYIGHTSYDKSSFKLIGNIGILEKNTAIYYIIPNKDKIKKVLKMHPKLMGDILLLSIKEWGDQVGKPVKDGSLDQDIKEFIQSSKKLPNAGLVIKFPKLESLKNWIIDYMKFEEQIYRSIENFAHSKKFTKQLLDFAIPLGYPDKLRQVGPDNIILVDSRTQRPYHKLMTQALITQTKITDENSLKIGSFQSNLLIDKLLKLPSKGELLTLSQTQSLVAFNNKSDLSYIYKNTNQNILEGPYRSLTDLRNSSKSPLDIKKFDREILTSDPREFRANLLLERLPFNWPIDNWLGFYSSFVLSKELIEYLIKFPHEWEFLSPEIQSQPCKIHDDPTQVNLPRIGVKLCDQFKNNTIGIQCRPQAVQSNDLQKDQKLNTNSTSLELCLDRQSQTIETVTYKKKMPKASKQSNSKILIPVENYLALFSSSNTLLISHYTNQTSAGATGTVSDDFLKKFNFQISDHFLKHKEYYKKYWRDELNTICMDIITYINLTKSNLSNLQDFSNDLINGNFCI